MNLGIMSCVQDWLACCFPKKKQPKPETTIYRSDYYNAQVRANLGMPERELEMPEPETPEPVARRNTNPTQPAPNRGPSLGLPIRPHVRFTTSSTTTDTSQKETGTWWSTSTMDREELGELFNLVHETLGHVPYAICGLGALIDHGFTRRRANKISIICPQECKHNVKAWAAARGYQTVASSIGIPTHAKFSPDAKTRSRRNLRRVRIKYIDSGFDKLQLSRSSFSNAMVLSMTSLLDNVAAGYIATHKRGDQTLVETVASDIFWLLDLATKRHVKLDPQYLTTFLGEEFFTAFADKYTSARPEMARAGIDVAVVLARHRDAKALREHDEMLRVYGLRGDVVEEKHGQFEKVRDLVNKRSVYTLRDGISSAGALSEAPPKPPPKDWI
ncbi:hypothetical protein GGS20DRAFT_73532 [Poronia punctata]|nr:hypothetical protein GGS20DRAFT_73532 [Poronia punctata]